MHPSEARAAVTRPQLTPPPGSAPAATAQTVVDGTATARPLMAGSKSEITRRPTYDHPVFLQGQKVVRHQGVEVLC